MERIAKFGHVWKNKKTGKTQGTKIDIKTIEELREYDQVPKSKETRENKEESLFGSTRKGRNE